VVVSEGIVFKGAEALSIENEQLRAVITVRGSKMVSLLDKTTGRELLLQSKNDRLVQGDYDSDYNAVDVCGFDEMFPTIDASFSEQAPWEGVRLPDHGEVWSLDWDCAASGNSLEAHVYGLRFPYRLSKRIYFKDKATLRIDYALQNLSPFDMDFIWAAHAMFALEDDSILVLPNPSAEATVTYSHRARLGRYGERISLGSKYALREPNGLAAVMPNEVYIDKYYLNDPLPEGYCGIAYPSECRACMLSFPVQTVPYLGVLLTNGLHLDNCAILEPCTGAFDRPDRARAFGMNSVLGAKGGSSWHLEFSCVQYRL